MKSKLKSLGFTSGHMHLLLVAVALFSVLMVAKSDVSFKTLFANADDESVMLTYDDVRSEVVQEYGDLPSNELDAEAEAQIALLDRSLDEGKVLGEAVGVGEIPSVDQIYSAEQMDTIKIFKIVDSTPESVKVYSDRMLRIKSYYNTTEMFASLNSNDPDAMKLTSEKTDGITVSMEKIPVPQELVEYHKYNVFYYQTLAAIGTSLATGDGDLSTYTKTLFSLTNKITEIENWISQNYGVGL
jgi:hypothetical protein